MGRLMDLDISILSKPLLVIRYVHSYGQHQSFTHSFCLAHKGNVKTAGAILYWKYKGCR